MERKPETKNIIASLDLDGCPEGPVLQPLEPKDEITQKYFSGWETPLAPWGGFGLDSGLEVVKEDEQTVLSFTGKRSERALVYGLSKFRDCQIVAKIKPLDAKAKPHNDHNDCLEALAGIVFRIQTSRAYYLFGIEGKRRAVLYRRNDDEWFVLAEQEVEVPKDDYLTLKVVLDGDGIRCRCEKLSVDFFCTDTIFKYGKAGFRALARSRLMLLGISQTPYQTARDERRRKIIHKKERKLGKNIPDPVLVRTFDTAELGGSPIFNDFIKSERYDMLVAKSESLKAMTIDGQTLWEIPLSVRNIEFSKGHGEHGRLLYGFTGRREVRSRRDIRGRTRRTIISDEMIVIQGGDGKVLARRKIPKLHEKIRMPDYSQGSGNLTDSGGFDIVLREWRDDLGGSGLNLWAYDKELNLLWHRKLKGAGYGHHYAVQFYDVDRDGRDELLAGGTLFDPEGNVLWRHDRDEEMRQIVGAGHYDAVALGAFADDEAIDPVAFLLGGSAGMYVVDGLTGCTRAFYRVGHAQGRTIGKVRDDILGEQILVATRWGNMGILTLFSGYGDRLWTIQPDYIGQGAHPIQWGKIDTKLIWTNTTGPVQAFYDGYGRKVKDLMELRRLWDNRMRTQVGRRSIRMGRDTTDYLCLSLNGKIYAFGPEGQ